MCFPVEIIGDDHNHLLLFLQDLNLGVLLKPDFRTGWFVIQDKKPHSSHRLGYLLACVLPCESKDVLIFVSCEPAGDIVEHPLSADGIFDVVMDGGSSGLAVLDLAVQILD